MPFHSRSNPNAGPLRHSDRPGPKAKRGWVRGVVDEIDPAGPSLKLRVNQGSRRGRRVLGQTVDIDASDAELVLPDGDGDGSASLRDIFPGKDVEVRFSSIDGNGRSLHATKVSYLGPDAPAGGLRRLWT